MKLDMNDPKDVQAFKEMNTYLMILAKGHSEGRVREADQLLIRLGTKRFGEPDMATLARLRAIRDIDQLEAVAERLVDFELESWGDLLAEA